MFHIPDFYQMNDLEWSEAVRIVKSRANGDLLEGMKVINLVWEDFVANERAFCRGEIDELFYGDLDDFCDHWKYELNAYNVVYKGMSGLFAPKEAA